METITSFQCKSSRQCLTQNVLLSHKFFSKRLALSSPILLSMSYLFLINAKENNVKIIHINSFVHHSAAWMAKLKKRCETWIGQKEMHFGFQMMWCCWWSLRQVKRTHSFSRHRISGKSFHHLRHHCQTFIIIFFLLTTFNVFTLSILSSSSALSVPSPI